MGSKNKVNRFVNAMLSADQETEQTGSLALDNVLNPPKGQVPEETAERLQISPELLEALNRERVKNSGRPKEGTRPAQEAGTKKGETRATFIVDKVLLRKIKYISVMETKLHKEIVKEALTNYIANWEKENGEINIKI